MKNNMPFFFHNPFFAFYIYFSGSSISMMLFQDPKKREGKIIPSKFQQASFLSILLDFRKIKSCVLLHINRLLLISALYYRFNLIAASYRAI